MSWAKLNTHMLCVHVVVKSPKQILRVTDSFLTISRYNPVSARYSFSFKHHT